MSLPKHIVSIGYGRNMFVQGNADRERMIACAQQGVPIDMIIFTHKNDRLSKECVTSTLTLYPTQSRSRMHMVLDAYVLARKIYEQSSHKEAFVVTTQDPFEAGLVGFFLKLRTRAHLVVQEHGDVFSTPYWKNESFLNTLRFFVGWGILARADIVRVVSKRMETFFRARGIQNITRLPVAVSIKNISSAHHVHTPSDTSFTFLTMARFVPQKNLTMLLRAFSVVYKKHPHSRLVLVGRGGEEKTLQALAAELFPHNCPVTFLPWSEDIGSTLASADVYVLSSNYEGWGRVLIEALAAGVPIVTTDVGCAGEVIEDGVHGIVTPVGDEGRFATALLRMIEDGDFYTKVKTTVQALPTEEIAGASIESYGAAWVRSLTVDE
jgi:glycosyltransferase involved in cell wall biosynthesis